MRVLIASKSAVEAHMGGTEKSLSFVINIQVFTPLLRSNDTGEARPVYPVPVDKKDFDRYEVGIYYDIT